MIVSRKQRRPLIGWTRNIPPEQRASLGRKRERRKPSSRRVHHSTRQPARRCLAIVDGRRCMRLVPKHPQALCGEHRGGVAEWDLSYASRQQIDALAWGDWR